MIENAGVFDGMDTKSFLKEHSGLVRKLLLHSSDTITRTKVLQGKKCPPARNGKYTSEIAKSFLIKVSLCGLGEIKRGSTCKSVVLHLPKHRSDQLPTPTKWFLDNTGLFIRAKERKGEISEND